MRLQFDGDTSVTATRQGEIVTLEIRGPIDRLGLETTVAMWRAMHPDADAGWFVVARLEQAAWLDEASCDFSPFAGFRSDRRRPPIAVVVAPEAHETRKWFLRYAEHRACEGRLCGVFTCPERALEWVRPLPRLVASF